MTVEKTIELRDSATIINDAKEKLRNLERTRKQIVIDTAIELEQNGKIPIHGICSFLAQELVELLKPRTVREYLPEKYKNRAQSENASKQKRTQLTNKGQHLAASSPPNLSIKDIKKEVTVLEVDNHKVFVAGIEADIRSSSPLDNETRDISVVDTALIDSDRSLPIEEHSSEFNQLKNLDKRNSNCIQCVKKDQTILEEKKQNNQLKEAIKKLPKSIQDNISILEFLNNDKNDSSSRDFKLDISWKEIDRCLPPLILREDDTMLTILGKIDSITGEVISTNLKKFNSFKIGVD